MIDLFAGTGAFTLAFENTGLVEVVYANDIEKNSKIIYDLNFNRHKLTLGSIIDICPTDIPEHDILCGGFPCQPFSIAGNKEGFNDARSNVFWSLLEIIKYHRPKCIVLENVKNLTSHDKGRTFQIITDRLKEENYNIFYKILNTSDTGIPQHRERIYIICIRSDINLTFDFNFEKKDRIEDSRKQISKMLDLEIEPRYFYNETSSIYKKLVENVIDSNSIYQYRRYYVRSNKNNECPTLCANMGTGGHNVPIILDHNNRIRKLTPRECFNFQGFPQSYKLSSVADCHLYKLAGNAVSVPVITLIANKLVPMLFKFV